MKIVAQSIVVPSTPYVHLGYTAAAYMARPQKTKIGGSATRAFGLAILLMLVVCMSKSGWAPLRALRKKAWVPLLGALISTVIGLSLMSWKE